MTQPTKHDPSPGDRRVPDRLEAYRQALLGMKPEAVLAWALQEFGARHVALASSLGAEDQLLTHLLVELDPAARIFTLDTGRLPPQTHEVMQATVDRYGIAYEVYSPDPKDLAELVGKKGPNLFYRSIEDRKACCEVRKLRPLSKAMATLRAWICGLRRAQSITRLGVEVVEWDAVHGIYKINPLWGWSEAELWKAIRDNQVPYNFLHDAGYPSVGCAPCTRAVAKGDDLRSGRWWWESAEHRECGLHPRRTGIEKERAP